LFNVDLGPEEIITGVQFAPIRSAAYAKLHQRASHFAIVGVAAALEIASGVIKSARVGVTGATPSAKRLTGVEQQLTGAKAAAETIAAASKGAGADLEDINSDLHASEDLPSRDDSGLHQARAGGSARTSALSINPPEPPRPTCIARSRWGEFEATPSLNRLNSPRAQAQALTLSYRPKTDSTRHSGAVDAPRSRLSADVQRLRMSITAGFQRSGGRKGAGVALTTRLFSATDSRGKAKQTTGSSRATIRCTSANIAWRRLGSSSVATPFISTSMSRSHTVAGTRCTGFQMCTPPELNQKSRLSAGSASVVSSLKYAASYRPRRT